MHEVMSLRKCGVGSLERESYCTRVGMSFRKVRIGILKSAFDAE